MASDSVQDLDTKFQVSVFPQPKQGSLVPRGSYVLAEPPFVSSLHWKYRERFCDYCFGSKPIDADPERPMTMEFQLTVLKACSKCNFVHYCSKACQRLAWGDHKVECSGLKALSQNGLLHPDEFGKMFMFCRALAKSQSDKGREAKGIVDDKIVRQFQDLQSTAESMESGYPLYKEFENFSREILPKDLFEGISEEDRLACYWKCRVNSTPITGRIILTEEDNIGIGCFLAISILDHACVPNAIYYNLRRTMYVRTIEDIHDFSWDKVHISYKGNLEIRLSGNRHQILWNNFSFTCNCRVCKDPHRDLEMTSVLCDSCGTGPVPYTVPPKSEHGSEVETLLPCLRCGQTVTDPKRLSTLYQIIKKTKIFVRALPNLPARTDLRNLLMEQEGLIHPHNKSRLCLQMVFLAMSLQEEDISRIHPSLKDALEYYCGPYNPLLVQHYMLLSHVYTQAGNAPGSTAAKAEAERIARVTYGEAHPCMELIDLGLYYKRVR